MKTIETKIPFGESLSRWAKVWLLTFWIFLTAPAWLVPAVLAQSTYEPYTFTTFAGLAGAHGTADGTGSDARFGRLGNPEGCPVSGPAGVAVDSAGNIYVADTVNRTMRKGFAAPTILNSGPGSGFNGGQFGITLTGPAGRLVVVEASTDLVRWPPLWTNAFTFQAALNFRDAQSGVYAYRFYRANLP